MLQILTVIAPLFIIIFASAILQKCKWVGENWSEVLNELAIKIGLPVLIFSALAKSPFSFSIQGKLILANSIFVLVCFGLAFITGKIFRLKKEMFRTLFLCFAFGNMAYLGIPVLIQTAGPKIVPTASLIVAIYLFWKFSIGIGYLEYTKEKNKKNVLVKILKNLFKNPLLISVILGILISSLKITLPEIIVKSLDMVTASVTPTVLIVIGLFIGKSSIGKITEWFPVLVFSVLTLMLLPAMLYFGLKIFGQVPAQFSSSIIESGMPLAITPFALADQYDLNKTFIARSIVLSTILAVISLPFWISLFS